VIEGCSEDALDQLGCCGKTSSAARIDNGTIYAAESQYCNGKIVLA
jgi:hypothetical protein